MRIDGQSIPTTFILGAGATRGAIPHVLVNRKRIKAPLNSDFFKIAQTYASASGNASADSKRLARLKAVFKSELPTKWPPPMETAFSLLYTAKDFPEIYSSRRGPKPVPGERRELEDFLRLLFDILCVLDHNSSEDTGYDRLASVLESGDALITLNYDTMLDSALVRRGWDPTSGYSLGGGTAKVKWRPPVGVTGPMARGVKLLKLHGSVNWWVRGTPRTLSNVFSNKPVAITAPRTNSQTGKLRQIIPPIYGKVFGHSHWRKLWTTAFDTLCSTQRLVVVGCSIVETDYHLQALLRRAVKERKRRGAKYRHVILVDRSPIRRRWQKVLKGAASRYSVFKDFESFLKMGVRV